MELSVLNCRRCGRIFRSENRMIICPICVKELEESFDIVKEYVYENPTATIVEVAKDTEVSMEQIKKWVREERLILTNPVGAGIDCQKCGVAINTGKFCNECKMSMANDLQGIYKKERPQASVEKKKDDKAKMRYLDRGNEY